MMHSRFIGGILLIIGTSLGGGMLILPVVTAASGFMYASLFLFAMWALMTIGAFLILEVNLWLPADANLISMAKATLGTPGEVIAWLSYLLLLYTLLAAYMAGGSDILQNLLDLAGLHLSQDAAAAAFVVLLGSIVIHGIRSVDWMNRGLMSVKLFALLILLIALIPHGRTAHLIMGHPRYLLAADMPVITSFGFAIIMPSLRSYFQSDVRKLKRCLLIGSVIPLVCYLAWDLAVQGLLSPNTLIAMTTSPHTTTDLTRAISHRVNATFVMDAARVFTSLCVATSFLGVSLCLSDFLADGFRRQKSGKSAWLIYAVTFLPALAWIYFYPGAFILGLSYAGIFVVILLMLLPAMMAYSGRYRARIATGYRFWGGKPLLVGQIMMASVLLLLGILQDFHCL